MTCNCDGMPMRVRAVCLPFVLAKNPNGDEHTIDVRKCQVARLDRKFAKQAWKAYKKKAAESQATATK